MFTIKPLTNEADFQVVWKIESAICAVKGISEWPLHIGGLAFDRYMFGNGANDVFSYGKLIIYNQKVIGYALVYMVYEGEKEFILRILPDCEFLFQEIILEIVNGYDKTGDCYVVANGRNATLSDALVKAGFVKRCEERFQAGFDLAGYQSVECLWETETIKILSEKDIPERTQYAAIPTETKITEKMYLDYFGSAYYQSALDYVIRDSSTGLLVGFITWWIDENSGTALLEPVACLEKYRRCGIMKRALFHGLNILKLKGVKYTFVSTSIRNEKSQLLYLSVGFEKLGKAWKWERD